MIAGLLVAGLLAAAEPSAAPAKRPPFRLVNEASFKASCTLMIVDDSLEAIRLAPGDTYTRSIPLKRKLQLVCINGKTRDAVLSPGQTYRLIEVDGHLEVAPPT